MSAEERAYERGFFSGCALGEIIPNFDGYAVMCDHDIPDTEDGGEPWTCSRAQGHRGRHVALANHNSYVLDILEVPEDEDDEKVYRVWDTAAQRAVDNRNSTYVDNPRPFTSRGNARRAATGHNKRADEKARRRGYNQQTDFTNPRFIVQESVVTWTDVT
jgi:hypothetical protein